MFVSHLQGALSHAAADFPEGPAAFQELLSTHHVHLQGDMTAQLFRHAHTHVTQTHACTYTRTYTHTHTHTHTHTLHRRMRAHTHTHTHTLTQTHACTHTLTIQGHTCSFILLCSQELRARLRRAVGAEGINL